MKDHGIRLKCICLFGLLTYVFMFMFSGIENIASIILLLTTVFYLIFVAPNGIVLNKKIALCGAIECVLIILSFFYADFSQLYLIKRIVALFMLVALLDGNERLDFTKKEERLFLFFYRLMLVICIANIALNFRSGLGDIGFESIGDRNFTAVSVFLLFLLSNRLGKLGGVLTGLIYVIFVSESRSMVLMILLFYASVFFLKITRKRGNIKIKAFWLLVVLTAFSIVLTYVWIYIIAVHGTDSYHVSLNDDSNLIRFVGNYKAIEMLTSNERPLLWGYGDYLLDYLGIADNFVRYMGVRLVQSHNSIINPLLRMGIIPGILYFAILGEVLDRYMKWKNLPYILPFLINALFMHSLLEMAWVTLWGLILLIPQHRFNGKLSIVSNVLNEGE